MFVCIAEDKVCVSVRDWHEQVYISDFGAVTAKVSRALLKHVTCTSYLKIISSTILVKNHTF